MASWKQVIDRHGPNVAYAALKQGTLPYVPHSLLLPGHDVKWPESHEFIMSRKYWNKSWKSDIAIASEGAEMPSEETIDEFIKASGFDGGPAMETRGDIGGRELKGIPRDLPEQQQAESVGGLPCGST